MKLYPLKFQPKFKYRIWGGNKLKTVLNKEYTGENIGESWEISDVKEDETVVTNGYLKGYTLKKLIQEFKGEFVGEKVYSSFGDEFPLLIKIIDAETPLSIQVHPNNTIAKERHNSFGKNEMWYIMEAETDSEIIVGFNKETNPKTFLQSIESGNILDILNSEKVKKGDTFYIPAGRIHAIGSGILLAEIQQTSDVTYRIFDYNRIDVTTGQERELHNKLALDVIDYKGYAYYKTTYKKIKNETNKLVHSPYFKTNFIKINGTILKDYSNLDSFIIYICVKGIIKISCENEVNTLKAGETILFPANTKIVELNSNFTSEILEIYL
jgi:mannose-6-phosphate isomerase